jgi:cytochrome b
MKDWFKTPHDVLEEFVLGFVVLHIAALILHEVSHGVPLAQAMVSGYQYREEKE